VQAHVTANNGQLAELETVVGRSFLSGRAILLHAPDTDPPAQGEPIDGPFSTDWLAIAPRVSAFFSAGLSGRATTFGRFAFRS
jgi:hypothetical protein